MGGGCHHLSWWHRHRVLQKSFSFAYFLASLPPASPPHPERWTWSSTNLSDPRLEEGSGKHSTNACGAGRLNIAQASRWEGNLVPHSARRSQTEEPPGVHEDWWLYPVLSSLRQTSQEWQLVLPGPPLERDVSHFSHGLEEGLRRSQEHLILKRWL